MRTQILPLSPNMTPAIAEAARILMAGEVVAFPTETVYGLGANGLCDEAVGKIFDAKGRPGDNPLILHISETQEIHELVSEFPEKARRLAEAFWPGPLTLVLPKSARVPERVSAGLSTVAVRCPKSEAARALIRACGFALAAPSANTSGRPSPTSAAHVFHDLSGKIPLILDGGECEVGLESTVLSLYPKPTLLRPGLVTKEMIEGVIGEEVCVHEAVMSKINGETPSPGMKHAHYAPNAQVFVAKAETPQDAAMKICEKYEEFASKGKKCTIFATIQTQTFYSSKNYVIMGDRDLPHAICARLFALLRSAEGAGFDVIFIESLKAKGAGLAFMNRALRSAGFNFI